MIKSCFQGKGLWVVPKFFKGIFVHYLDSTSKKSSSEVEDFDEKATFLTWTGSWLKDDCLIYIFGI
jgi:hypothetical protein